MTIFFSLQLQGLNAWTFEWRKRIINANWRAAAAVLLITTEAKRNKLELLDKYQFVAAARIPREYLNHSLQDGEAIHQHHEKWEVHESHGSSSKRGQEEGTEKEQKAEK